MKMERTLIILKPDCVARRLIGRVISRFEDKGLCIAAMKYFRITPAIAKKHYAEHLGKPFYPGLIKFITSGPVVVMALEGLNAVAVARKLMGATAGFNAEPGTIRGDFGNSQGFNLVHGSDSPASAKRELALYFKKSDFVPTDKQELRWNYDWAGSDPR